MQEAAGDGWTSLQGECRIYLENATTSRSSDVHLRLLQQPARLDRVRLTVGPAQKEAPHPFFVALEGDCGLTKPAKVGSVILVLVQVGVCNQPGQLVLIGLVQRR